MKRFSLFILLFLPFILFSQKDTSYKGIKWVTDLSWEQVLQKAKSENKYIFLDCYATWCVPCKQMEKKIYSNDTVGRFFNSHFISVKVQTDLTKNDDQRVKNWYADAAEIVQKYRVQLVPTYIFLSPDGLIVHKENGYKEVGQFVAVAMEATSPGKRYNNPYSEYDSLLADYRTGMKTYKRMPYMVKTAIKLNEMDVAKLIAKDYGKYLSNLSEDQLYTKENIEFLSFVISSKSELFRLFYPDGAKIDSTLNLPGYARRVVDSVIFTEEVEPFIKVKAGGMTIMGGTRKKVAEPNWLTLYRTISSKYNTEFARRNVLEGKIVWNESQGNLVYTKYFVQKWRHYGMDTTSVASNLKMNSVAWQMFEKISDLSQLKVALNWMEGVVIRSKAMDPTWEPAAIDTYACLLYKTGDRNNAIAWEQKAVHIAKAVKLDEDVRLYTLTLKKMIERVPDLTVTDRK